MLGTTVAAAIWALLGLKTQLRPATHRAKFTLSSLSTGIYKNNTAQIPTSLPIRLNRL